MRRASLLRTLAVLLMMSSEMLAQVSSSSTTNKDMPSPMAQRRWAYSLTIDGFIVANQSYVNPVFTADRDWLHLEGRYNSENLDTGSLWTGYNFSFGKAVSLVLTPMIGGIFGKTTGIAPGIRSFTHVQENCAVGLE